jgi:hypothetical protein
MKYRRQASYGSFPVQVSGVSAGFEPENITITAGQTGLKYQGQSSTTFSGYSEVACTGGVIAPVFSEEALCEDVLFIC